MASNEVPSINQGAWLSLSHVSKEFVTGQGPVQVLKDVSFELARNSAVALVGQSGSGKSTLANIIVGLEGASSGHINLGGQALSAQPRSLLLKKRIQMVFQDPFGSLNPVHTVTHHLARPLLRHGLVSSQNVNERVFELLESVGLSPASDFADRHPYALSGGQRQRVAIARTLAVEPELLILDEPTSMLDVSIRHAILDLLQSLRAERGLTYLLITHDFSTAEHLADEILVLDRGEIVERATTRALLETPSHPYSQDLLAAVPKGDRQLFQHHPPGPNHG